ncbi:MAG: hypothetical protein AAGA76_04810 [Pseudomonadota bacterium]
MAKNKKTGKQQPVTAVEEMAGEIPAKKRQVASVATNSTPGKVNQQTVNHFLAGQASILLALAACIGISLGIAMFALEGGREGVPAMGGILDVQIPKQSAQIILLLDILFPVSFGAGFAVLATSLQSRGNRPLIRLIMTTIMVVVTADFFENALVYNTMTGDEPYLLRWPLTVIKYAGLAFAGLMLSAILPVHGIIGQLVHVITRYIFPLGIAVLVSGLGGLQIADIVGVSFPVSLLLLSVYSAQLSKG